MAIRKIYRVGTWDVDRQQFTPQPGVPCFVVGFAGLRHALRRLRAEGFDRIEAKIEHVDPCEAPEIIGAEFVRLLRRELTAEQWEEMTERNRAEPFTSSVCHSHDYVDANVVMADAFRVFGVEPNDGWCAAWRAAWPTLCGAAVSLTEAEAAELVELVEDLAAFLLTGCEPPAARHILAEPDRDAQRAAFAKLVDCRSVRRA